MHPYDRAFRLVLPAGAVAVLATVLAVGWYTQPDRLARGYAPEQPIPFSHLLHTGTLKVPCEYSTPAWTGSRVAGIRRRGVHRLSPGHPHRPAGDQKLTALQRGPSPALAARHTLPDHVFFDHRPHVNAGIVCQTCHGECRR
jgi:hypothetical protein